MCDISAVLLNNVQKLLEVHCLCVFKRQLLCSFLFSLFLGSAGVVLYNLHFKIVLIYLSLRSSSCVKQSSLPPP